MHTSRIRMPGSEQFAPQDAAAIVRTQHLTEGRDSPGTHQGARPQLRAGALTVTVISARSQTV
jgi:hypothetical protein